MMGSGFPYCGYWG